MTVLGTTTAAPNFYADKLRGAGEALQLAFAASKQRQDERRRRELEEIHQFYTTALQMPELAGTWGEEVKRKYGSKYPGVAPLIEALQNRESVARSIESAGDRYLDTLGRLEQEYDGQARAVSAMPDELPVPVPAFGLGMQFSIPNPVKAIEGQRLSAVNRGLFPVVAAQKLHPRERAAARIGAKSRGYELPTDFDPFRDLSEEGKAILAQQIGLLTGDTAEWARTEGELQPSRAKLQEQGFQVGERTGREKHERAEREAKTKADEQADALSHQRQVERMRIDDSLQRGRENLDTSNERSLIGLRHSLESGKAQAAIWKLAVDESKSQLEQWDAGLKDSTQGLSGSSAVGKAKQEYLNKNGYRPKKMSEAHGRILERHVKQWVQQGDLKPDQVEAAIVRATEKFTELTARGVSPAEAIRRATSTSEEPERETPLLFRPSAGSSGRN